MKYTDNQNLGTSYEPEVAMWCNENNAYIEQVGNEFFIRFNLTPTEDELALQESEKELSETESQINDIKDRLLYAILLDDNETIEQLKTEYKDLINE